ncbi:MAG: flagellar basal-body rod protein FlgF [Methylococcales bacterium]|nr:flagellar basal-body rod protein FlgF [Methylococcales bacterium]
MDRSLFIAMSGAKQTLLAQSANANNLANAQTTGFKADLNQMRSQSVFGPGYPSRVYAQSERPAINLNPGPLQTTGNDLDIAIAGSGFLAVQTPDGNEAYTRSGDLRLTAEGQLQTRTGLPVIGNNGPIAIPPSSKITFHSDGTISIVPLGNNPNAQAIVDRLKLVNPPPADLYKREDGLLHLRDGGEADPDITVKVNQGLLEGANVNPIQGMVDMIELARNFELQTKVMQSTDENAAAAAELLRMA